VIDQGYIIRKCLQARPRHLPCAKSIFVTGMLTRDLFAVANPLVLNWALYVPHWSMNQ